MSIYGLYARPISLFERTVTHQVLVTTEPLSSRCDLVLGADFIHNHQLAYDPVLQRPPFAKPIPQVTFVQSEQKEPRKKSIHFMNDGKVQYPGTQKKRKGLKPTKQSRASQRQAQAEMPPEEHKSQLDVNVESEPMSRSVFTLSEQTLPLRSETIVLEKVPRTFLEIPKIPPFY